MTGIQYMIFLVVMETYNHHFYIAFWITSIAGLTRIYVLGIYVIELSIFHNNAKMQQEYLLSNTLLNIQMCTHKSRYMVCYHVSKVCIICYSFSGVQWCAHVLCCATNLLISKLGSWRNHLVQTRPISEPGTFGQSL